MKKRRRAAVEDVRREVGEAAEDEEEAVEESVSDSSEVVGSREFWRWRRLVSMSKND